ncbi:MAG: integral rane sensor signal transduction histidine kinase [Paenibacillaceae bacterium]|nr:integral rane sensor signal transduction histidine kinase [Paenibacillaceae bacterium]
MIQNITQYKRLIWSWCAGVLLCLALAPGVVLASESPKPVARQGVMDFKQWNFDKGGTVELTGEWEFYWDRLLVPADIPPHGTGSPRYVPVPHRWNQEKEAGSDHGVATYRLTLKIGEGQAARLKALYIRGVASAYRLWVNGELLTETGKVGINRSEMIPMNYSKQIVFPVAEGDNELVIQVSNFVQRKGGLWMPIEFGNEQDVGKTKERRAFGQIFIASALATMGSYHFGLFFLRNKDKLSLLTGIYCTFMSLRVLALGDTLLVKYFPWMQWEWAVKIEYLSVYLGVPCFAFFSQLVYPKEFKVSSTILIAVISSLFSSVVVIFPARIYTFTMEYFEVFLIVVVIYWLHLLILAATRQRIGAKLNVIAVCVMFYTIVNDILYYNQTIQSFDMSPYGVLFFFFVQTLVLAGKYSKEYVDVEHISDELALTNQRLEEKIRARTEELEITNAYLVYANEHLNQLENSRRELIANITHELGTPMTSIQGYMKALLDGVIQPDQQYIQIIYDKIQVAERLVQDLFDLTKLEEGQTTFQMVDVIVDELFDEHFSNYRYDIETHGIRFELSKPEPRGDKLAIVRIDPIRIRQVVTNLVNNALNYTEEGGCIAVRGWYGQERLVIAVSDTGKGISPELVPYIFDRFVKGSGTRRYTKDGSGLGLAIAKEIVMHHGGIITVLSEQGKGTTFQFDIPVEFISMVVD